MNEIFFQEDGETCWRCLWCKRTRSMAFNGSYVKVANEALGVVCTDQCEGAARESIRAGLSAVEAAS